MKMYLWEFMFFCFFFSRIASWLDCKELYTMWFCSLIGIEPPRPRKEVPKAAQKIRKKGNVIFTHSSMHSDLYLIVSGYFHFLGKFPGKSSVFSTVYFLIMHYINIWSADIDDIVCIWGEITYIINTVWPF